MSGYAVFLALPGLIVATLLTGFTYLALYGWKWEACMLLGGILSATDPVAVVALLRDMGVKKSLATREAGGVLTLRGRRGSNPQRPEGF